jgi:hypothetical protein
MATRVSVDHSTRKRGTGPPGLFWKIKQTFETQAYFAFAAQSKRQPAQA